MKLDEIKDMVERGLTNTAIAQAVNLSIRQVQRLKRKLLETPVKLPKTTAQLVKLLRKKAAQGDIHAIKLLLKDFKNFEAKEKETELTNAEHQVRVAWHFLRDSLNEDDQKTLLELLRRAVERETPSPSAPPLSVETPTPLSSPSQGSTGEGDPKPPPPGGELKDRDPPA